MADFLAEERGLGSGVCELSGDFVELSTDVVDLTREAATLTVEQVAAYTVDTLRERLPAWLAQHVHDSEDLRQDVQAGLRSAIAQCTEADLALTLANYRAVGQRVRFQPFDPAAQFMARAYLQEVPTQTVLFGADYLDDALEDGPCLLVCNSLSYSDAQHIDLLLFLYGHEDVADRLVYVVPPKIYDNPYRRMAALSFNTLPMSRVGGPDTPTNPAELLLKASELMNNGFGVLLFAEGGRSRTGRLRSFLRLATLACQPGTSVIPMALTGTDVAFPMHEHQLIPAAVTMSVGDPLSVDELGPEGALTAAWRQVADLLPEEYQPDKDTPPLI